MQENKSRIRLFPVLLKATFLLVLFNFGFAALSDAPFEKLSFYNVIFPGRERLPYGEVPESYSLSPSDIDMMFASHVLVGAEKGADEYRVLLIGDSSVWGTLLTPQETLAGQLNALPLTVCGRAVRAYNLGYPTLSLFKELMLLDYSLQYQPDMVIWLTTLQSFPEEKQFTSPVVADNAPRARDLIERYHLALDPDVPQLEESSPWNRTLLGQRRFVADFLRLQIYGALWASTGIDQVYPQNYTPAQVDLEPGDDFQGLHPADLTSLEENLALDVLEAGMLAARVPTLLVNEPILVSDGANSDIRYNFFYPRWAYDEYRRLLAERSTNLGWNYFDFWDLVPAA